MALPFQNKGLSQAPLTTQRCVQEIARLVGEITGVRFGARQAPMMETRLQKRMSQIGMTRAEEYLDYVRNHLDTEVPKLVTLLTTHHTYFFREFSQFQFLEEKGLLPIVRAIQESGGRTLRVWSSACSQGQEVYSLAMFLTHHLQRLDPEMQVSIFGSDVDPESVAHARNGVYRWDEVKQIPLTYLWNHWVRGTGDIRDFAKARASIREVCKFGTVNLVDMVGRNPPKLDFDKFDLIFCRNVFMYFEPELVRRISDSLLQRLTPHGLFFIGLSESLISTGLPVLSIAPSIYAARSGPSARASEAIRASVRQQAETRQSKLRVFCIDDSPTILTLLKRVLEPEFEVVGNARNGLEAVGKLRSVRADVVTLDIHMPQQGGIEYLEKNLHSSHPPVVILSSVPREDSGEALRCLELGARDYIEKPELADLDSRSEEIRTKLRCAILNSRAVSLGASDIERSFHHRIRITEPRNKLRILVSGMADRAKIASVLKECTGPQPPTLVLLEGAAGVMPALATMLGEATGRNCRVLDTLPIGSEAAWDLDCIYVADYQAFVRGLAEDVKGKSISVVMFASTTQSAAQRLPKFANAQLILEDAETSAGLARTALPIPVAWFVPYTSMAYHSNQFFSEKA